MPLQVGYVTISGERVVSNNTIEVPADACDAMDIIVKEKMHQANSGFSYGFVARENGDILCVSDNDNPKYYANT